VASKYTDVAQKASITAKHALETTTRRARSALAWEQARKRCPSGSRSTAPAPRTASERSAPDAASAVGWNWINSISAITAPARAAASRPCPVIAGEDDVVGNSPA